MVNALLWNLLLTGVLAVVLTGLCRLSWMRKRPALVHCLWLLLLSKLVTPSLIPVPLLPAVGSSEDRDAVAAVPGDSIGHRGARLSESAAAAFSRMASLAPVTVSEADGISGFSGIRGAIPPSRDEVKHHGNPSGAPQALGTTTWVPYLRGLLVVSWIGTFILLAVYVVHAVRLDRWLRRAGVEDAWLAACCAEMASAMGVRRGVRCRVVDSRTTPLLWGWLWPTVVVPRELLADFGPERVRTIVAHELAHLARRDHWANVFVCVVKALLWWNPVVWWANRELRVAQEMCCDAMAIDRCKANRRTYATTLLKALDFIQSGPPAIGRVALGMGSRGTILRRFEMIGEKELSYRVSRWAILGVLMLSIPLICMPVRGQEKKPATNAAPAVADTDKDKATAEFKPAKSGDSSKADSIDPETRKLGDAMLLTQGKGGQLQLNMRDISRLVTEYRGKTGRYPEDLAELKKPLPKDVYSPSGEPYHYEAGRNRFVLSSCGKDGVYGNDDDEVSIADRGGATSGQRHDLYPLEKEETVAPQKERSHGQRPQGKCSISGKVVSAETGKPVAHATVYLFYLGTHGSIFVNVASDGTFVMKDIPTGPYFLQTTNTAGYQDTHYDPDGRSAPLPQFSLGEGEHRVDVVFKVKPACRISGTIRDENGKIPADIDDLTVLAWFEDDAGKGYRTAQARINGAEGSYFIDRLDNKPAYVMVINWKADQKDNACPPIYYPSTFSREDAKRITFDEKKHVENVDITLKKEGGLVLEGTVVDEAGSPVPEVFVIVHRRDMLFDFVTDYTDDQGKYRICGLGKGEFLVHVDAAHRGLVRMRTPLDLDGAAASTRRDFTLAQGVTISGQFVDEEGKEWQIGRSFGYAAIVGKEVDPSVGSFSLTGFRNKYGPTDIREAASGSFLSGEGGYGMRKMVFRTESNFLIQGMMPGQTEIGFSPKEEGRDVVEIRYDGRNIKESGIQTKPGDEIKDVTIVIGKQ